MALSGTRGRKYPKPELCVCGESASLAHLRQQERVPRVRVGAQRRHVVTDCEVDNNGGDKFAPMTGERHSWIEVDPEQLAKALSQLRKLPKPRKRVRKAILSLENGELVLSDGLNVVRTKASGLWKVPAVTSYVALRVLRELAKSADPEKPLILEGVEGHFKVANSRFPCSFQNPEINVQGVLSSERERQRVTEDNSNIVNIRNSEEFEAGRFMLQIEKLYPNFVSYSVIEFILVTIPDFPNLVLHVHPPYVEFHIVTDPAADPTDWRTPTKVWKRLAYPIIRQLGLGPLVKWASEAAASRNRKDSASAE